VVADLSAEDRVILVPMAPHSVQVYEAAARRDLDHLQQSPRLECVPPWGESEELIAAHVDQIQRELAGEDSTKTHLILSAHSLPSVVIERGDPYARQFESAAQSVASRLRFPTSIAYQSQGADGGRWQGPDLNQVVTEVATEGVENVAVAPIGFLCEHIETLYDLDIETKALVEGLGKRFFRVPALGTHPGLIRAVQEAVQSVD
jgi:ferrochelatase